MFYILVFAGLAFFAFGVASTLLSSLKIQREYELITTELVRTDGSLRELEVKYDKSQNELKMFRLKIETSSTWTKNEIGQTYGQLERLKAEYIRIKVRSEKDTGVDRQQVEEKCKKLLSEAAEYDKLLAERNSELGELKNVFANIKIQLENNQKALADTHEHLRSLRSAAGTNDKIKEVIGQLEDLRQSKDSATEVPKKISDEGTGDTEEINTRNHIDTMKSLLSSLDKKIIDSDNISESLDVTDDSGKAE